VQIQDSIHIWRVLLGSVQWLLGRGSPMSEIEHRRTGRSVRRSTRAAAERSPAPNRATLY
jgi:hypothetical protein